MISKEDRKDFFLHHFLPQECPICYSKTNISNDYRCTFLCHCNEFNLWTEPLFSQNYFHNGQARIFQVYISCTKINFMFYINNVNDSSVKIYLSNDSLQDTVLYEQTFNDVYDALSYLKDFYKHLVRYKKLAVLL